MVVLADALDPEKKGVGAAQGSCLGDYLANFIERRRVLSTRSTSLSHLYTMHMLDLSSVDDIKHIYLLYKLYKDHK